MAEIYLDNSATTKPCPTAIKRLNDAVNESWHNPSSLYKRGMEAEMLVSRTRNLVAKLMSVRPEEIFFTASGTESNNTALFSYSQYAKSSGNRIVTSSIEHPSVKNVMNKLEENGFEVIYLKPDQNGIVSESSLKEAITPTTALVSLMYVNNETGAIQPVEKIRAIAKENGANPIIHCDAVQAFGKIAVNPKKMDVDLVSASGHKIHALKGVGILYKSSDIPIKPYIFGGGQEKGFRSGTEAVPNIASLLGALEELGDIEKNLEKISEINAYAKEKLLNLYGAELNSPENALPYVLNISFCGYRSETLLHFLEADGIMVSSGSACSKGSPSSVLSQMGISRDRADSALRISFSRFNQRSDIDALADSLKNAQNKLKRK